MIGGLTGVMVAVVPFDWQVHDTHFVVAHLHYVLVGGFVFPMLAALYYWMPHVTGRKRFFKLGETAFWLIAVGFHVTFLAVHWVGLLGQRRRIYTYDGGTGLGDHQPRRLDRRLRDGDRLRAGASWTSRVNAVVAVRGLAQPVEGRHARMGDADAAARLQLREPPRGARAATRSTTIPSCRSRIARGEGYLGDASPEPARDAGRAHVATGEPDHVVVFPANTALPILDGRSSRAASSSACCSRPTGSCRSPSLGRRGPGGMRWAWSARAPRADEGPIDAGHGLALPLAAEAAEPPGWWGSLFLLLADATLFGSLLFGYAFLWTVAPNWPPPSYLAPGPLGLGLAAAGAALAPLGHRSRRARRVARRRALARPRRRPRGRRRRRLRRRRPLLARRPDPTAHAYDATLWVLAGYVLFHAALLVLMTLFLVARRARGFLARGRFGEMRIVRLWADYLALTTILGLGACVLPGALS